MKYPPYLKKEREGMTIKELYESGISIFAALQEKDVPWKSLEISGELDTIFKNIKAKNNS